MTDYLPIMNSPETPYRFLLEQLMVGAGQIYVSRTGTAMTLFPVNLQQQQTLTGNAIYKLDFDAVAADSGKYTYKTINSTSIIDDSKYGRLLSIVSDTSGGLQLPLSLSQGKKYLVKLSIRTNNGGGQKVIFSYQDATVKQWYTIEGNQTWRNISYLIAPESESGILYLYNDKPVGFTIRMLEVIEVIS